MSAREKALMRTMQAARANLDAIEKRKRRSASKKLVGKCFKYRNCFSLPQSDADYWWLYLRVLGVDDYGHPVGVTFQVDKDGRAEIEPSLRLMSLGIERSGYIEIPQTEFVAAQRSILAAVERLVMQKPASA